MENVVEMKVLPLFSLYLQYTLQLLDSPSGKQQIPK